MFILFFSKKQIPIIRKTATQYNLLTTNCYSCGSTGTQAPGNEELAAIQAKYKDATMDQLNEGHQLYTATACVRCHGAESIYQYDNNEWIGIIDRMAGKARITDSQKDAISKYVFAIKATQAK